VDQGLGFLFGVAPGHPARGDRLFVYDTIVTSQDVAIIDDSRSAVSSRA
jgi:membrane protein required for colicin V production